jgi:hypothetical protein
MALSMACALLNVNPKDIRCTPDAIILPVPDRQPVVIPSRTENSTLGRVGAIVDVPYFGKSGEDGWRTMYDFPRFEEATAHIKIGQFWAMILREESVKKNNATADMILKEVIAPAIDVPELQQYLLHVPDALDTKARLPVIQAVIKKLQADAPELFTKSEKELDEPERPLASATKALQTIARENGITQDLLARDRLDLMNRLQGKALIINWTAQGNLDHYPTPLHPTCPGGVIQGTMLNGILTRDLWRRAPHWITAALTFLVGLFATILVALLPPWRALFCTLLIMIAYGALNGIVFFDYGNLIVGAAGPLSACALVWSGLTLTNFITAARERARFRRQFSSYIDPAIVEYYEEHPELTSVERQRRVYDDLRKAGRRRGHSAQ